MALRGPQVLNYTLTLENRMEMRLTWRTDSSASLGGSVPLRKDAAGEGALCSRRQPDPLSHGGFSSPSSVFSFVFLPWDGIGIWTQPVSFQCLPWPWALAPGLASAWVWGNAQDALRLSLPPGPCRDLPTGKETQGGGRNQISSSFLRGSQQPCLRACPSRSCQSSFSLAFRGRPLQTRSPSLPWHGTLLWSGEPHKRTGQNTV